MNLRFDRYYDNHALQTQLERIGADHPGIVSLGTLGRSFEGATSR